MKKVYFKEVNLRLIILISVSFFSNAIAQNTDFEISIENVSQNLCNYDDGERAYQTHFNLSKFPVGHPDIKALSALILVPNGTQLEIQYNAGQRFSASS